MWLGRYRREITILRHDTTAHDKEDLWCVRRMWVPPAQVLQGEKLVDALLTGYQQPNFRNGVDFVHRRLAALNSGVPSQTFARDYELDANFRNVGKPCKRHRVPVYRRRQWNSLSIITLFSAFEVAGVPK